MQCERCLTHTATGMTYPHESSQIVGQQTEPKYPGLQKAFYYYDPQQGTKYRLVNATATVAASTTAGAAGSFLMTLYLPGLVTSGNSIFDRAIVQMDRAIPLSPFFISGALGASLGAAGAVWLINFAYQGGLKPRTVAAVRGLMNELIHQVESNIKSIQDCKISIQTNEGQLAIGKEQMLAEKESNRIKAQNRYDCALQNYQKKIDRLRGELKGCLTEIFDSLASPSRLPTYEEAVSNTRRGGSYQLGQFVSNFIEDSDFSFSARERLITALLPYLDEREIGNVRRILNKFPSFPPIRLPIRGPLEKEYRKIESQCNSDQRKIGELETKVRELTAQYNCFELGPDGKVKAPSVADFSQYLPD